MQERVRQSYLKAMGIEVLIPRFVLPGAAPSPVYDLGEALIEGEPEQPVEAPGAAIAAVQTEPVPAAAPAPEPESVEPVADKPRRINVMLDAVPTSKTQTNSSPANDNDPSDSAPLDQPLTIPPFRLQLSLAAEGVMFISDSATDAATNHSLQLLEAIRLALGYTAEQRMENTFFRWPFLKTIPAGADEWLMLRESLESFIDRQLEMHKPSTVVIFGELSARLLLTREKSTLTEGDEQAWTSMLGQPQSLAAVRDGVVVTHGIEQMLVDSSLKRETWQHLLARSGLVRR